MNRTKNTIRNIGWGFLYQFFSLLFPFIVRTIILRILGREYLGLSSLFTSILNVLNMAELGFSSAIVFSMYEPIAKKDSNTICALLAFYRKVYAIIGCCILGVGLLVFPFLSYLINGEHPANVNIYILFAIYLSNTALSYFMFAYKSSLLAAHHRNDLTSKINLFICILQYSTQIVVLCLFENYYFYIIILPLCTILSNLMNNMLANKYYPQYKCRGILRPEIVKVIKKQVEGLMVSKICGTLRNSLDSIIISSFIGLATVAIYGNYYYILTAVHGVLTIIGVSMKAGVGNSIVKESKAKNYSDFNKFTFIYMWLASWFACCMVCLYQPFMLIWTGSEQMLFSNGIMFLFCIYFYGMCMMDMRNVYMDAAGLWWEARYRSIVECIANLILNIVLGYFFGVVGVIIATLFTMLTINLVYGTKILFDNFFVDENLLVYLGKNAFYFCVMLGVSSIVYILCGFITMNSIWGLILKGIICAIAPNVLFSLIYWKNLEFQKAKQYAMHIIRH